MFNPKMEAISRDELHALQSERLRWTVKHEYDNVPVYRARMDAKGIRPGDILLAANGQTITSTQDLTRLKQSLGLGDTVSLTYLRDGQSYTVDVALVDPQEDNR